MRCKAFAYLVQAFKRQNSSIFFKAENIVGSPDWYRHACDYATTYRRMGLIGMTPPFSDGG